MKDRFIKASNLDEPDEIMLLSDDEYEVAYDETLVKFSIEDEINDLLYQKDELESDNKKIEFILNNETDRKSTRLNSSHVAISYAVFCLKKKKKQRKRHYRRRSNRSEEHTLWIFTD